MTLDQIAESVGTVTDEQETDEDSREQTTDLPRRDREEYRGGWDTSH